jgi:hypothetical protein
MGGLLDVRPRQGYAAEGQIDFALGSTLAAAEARDYFFTF